MSVLPALLLIATAFATSAYAQLETSPLTPALGNTLGSSSSPSSAGLANSPSAGSFGTSPGGVTGANGNGAVGSASAFQPSTGLPCVSGASIGCNSTDFSNPNVGGVGGANQQAGILAPPATNNPSAGVSTYTGLGSSTGANTRSNVGGSSFVTPPPLENNSIGGGFTAPGTLGAGSLGTPGSGS